MRLAAIGLVVLCTGTSLAQNKGFGLGVIIGEPTGLSGKYWLSGSTAVDLAAAWSFGKTSAFQAQADFVLHQFDLFNVEKGKLPIYYGIGGAVLFSRKLGLGVRVPVGIDYEFAHSPLDLFLEVVPKLALSPATRFDLNAGLGMRFWFN